MDKMNCPYCEVEVSTDEVDRDGGACPECGAMVTGSLLFAGGNDFYEDEDDFGDE